MKSRRRKIKIKKGGWGNNVVAPLGECDPNDLPNITDKNKLQEKYVKCCPKNIFGQKNKSPYCKQIDLNWRAKEQFTRDVAGYYGDETDVNKIKQSMNELEVAKKPWYKFWGGKTKKRRRKVQKQK